MLNCSYLSYSSYKTKTIILTNINGLLSYADECPWNKTLTGHRGYFNSPRFALDYPGNLECTWRIHVSNKQRVALVFLGPINFDPNCTDVLEIRDGLEASSPLLKRYCTTTATPSNIFSSGRDMYVQFKSDRYIRRDGLGSGFRAAYFAKPVKSGRLAAQFTTILRDMLMV